MNLRQFLKPEIGKVLIFFLLFIFLGLAKRAGACLYDNRGVLIYCDRIIGLPLEFNLITDYSTPIDFPSLFIDIIFWYIISCFIFLVYNKIKK